MMYNNVIGDCPKQCDVGVFDFIDDYRKDIKIVLEKTKEEKQFYTEKDKDIRLSMYP